MIEKPGDNETKRSCGSLSFCVGTNVDALGVQAVNVFGDISMSARIEILLQ